MRKKHIDIADSSVPDTALCGRLDIIEWLGICPSTFDNWRRDGKLPKPCTPENIRSARWRVGDVRRFYSSELESESEAKPASAS